MLVEDNQVFREALELLLGLRDDIDVVASVADGTLAVPACIEHKPDVVVMDYRLPGLDGVQATRAVRRELSRHERRRADRFCEPREMKALEEAGAVACLTKDQDLDEIVGAILAQAARAFVNLTAENTAIVLDSTADFPEAAERFPNWRMVPLYVRFGDESYRDYVELGPHEFYERLRDVADDADDLAADARRLRGDLRGARRLRTDPLDPHPGVALGNDPERASRGRGVRRQGADDRLGHRVGGDRDARLRDPAPARARHDRRGGRRARRALQGERRASSSPSTRSSSCSAAAGSGARRSSPGSCCT